MRRYRKLEGWIRGERDNPVAKRSEFGKRPIPARLDTRALERAIAESSYIYSIKDNFDGEGTPGYSRETWDRATTFLREFAQRCATECGCAISAPVIGPGPNGSIDIIWKENDYRLLLNIPAEPSADASFYGDDRGRARVEGEFKLSANNIGLMMWLRDR
jgi:hypothetical protein